MASVLIPMRFGIPSFRERVELSGVEFLLDFAFNDREGAWYMSVADVDAVAIIDGVKLVLGFPLLANCVDVRRPPGEFVLLDTSASGAEAETVLDVADDFNEPRVVLVYTDDA